MSNPLTGSVQCIFILLTALSSAGTQADESPLSAVQGLQANGRLAIDPELGINFPNGRHGHMDSDALQSLVYPRL